MNQTNMLTFDGDDADGSLTEYDDPVLYDIENRWADDDNFYLALAQEVGEPVLDVACGTGRLTRAIAEAGIEVVGTDFSLPMLNHARGKVPDFGIEWIHADCRTMQLDRQFQLLFMTSHGFQHMLTDDDIDAFLQRANVHLVKGGTLAFETRNFAARSYITSAQYQPAGDVTLPNGDVLNNWMRSTYDADTQCDTIDFKTVNQTTSAVELAQTVLRYVSVAQLNKMLASAGFVVRSQYGYWDKSAFTPQSKEIITICQKQ